MTSSGDNFRISVAHAVRAEISRRQRTVTEVAAAIGVSRNTLSRLLNGQAAFDVQQLDDIAAHLGVPVALIFESAALSAEAVA